MPKNHVGRMPTDVGAVDVSPAAVADESPQAVAEDGLGRTNEVSHVVVGEALPEAYAEDAVPPDGPDVDPYAGLTLAELRAAADGRGVPSYGTKAQVAERLREDDSAAVSEPFGE